MFDDEDFSCMTGGLGDLDGDGEVDFEEYLNEEDDFQRIIGSDNNEYSGLGDDDEDDAEVDEDYEYENGDETAENAIYLPEEFDISKLTLTIGAHTSLDYDGKPIDNALR